MNKSIKIGLAILILVAGLVGFKLHKSADNKGLIPTPALGSDGGNSQYSISTSKEFNQIGINASASSTGIIRAVPGRVLSLEITGDSTSVRYLQLFNLAPITIPARAASVSSPGSLAIYKGSTSWASATNLAARPLGSYQRYSSPSLVFSLAIPAATASTSPTIVKVSSTDLAPAFQFSNGIMFGVSTNYSTYASPSTANLTASRIKIKLHYE